MKICNFCAKKYEELLNINNLMSTTANKSVTILEGLKIFNNDIIIVNNLNAVICTKCLKRLRNCYEFVLQIKESEKKLITERDIRNEHDYSQTEKNISEIITNPKDEMELPNLKLGLDNSDHKCVSPLPNTLTDAKDINTNLSSALDSTELKLVPILPKTSNNVKASDNIRKEPAITKSRLYKCLECSETFKSFKQLREHEQKSCANVCLQGVFTCKYCHVCFNSKDTLKIHQIEKHKYGQFRCYLCKDKSFAAKGYLIRHIERIHQHKSLPFFCGECTNITLLVSPEEHFIQNHQLNTQKDDIQQQDGNDDEDMDLEMHEEFLDEFLLAYNNENSFQFSECWEALDLHLPDMLQGNSTNLTNSPEISDAFSCPKCFEQFKNTQPLLKHLAETHNLPVLLCRTCRKSFASLKDFKFHKEMKCFINSTFDSPNLNCPYCSKTFKNTLNLKQHLRIVHTQLKRHICQLCDKQFSTLDHLKKHVLSQHQNERKHLCKVCDKTFTQLVHLKQHLAIHTTGKTLQCLECLKKFWRKIDLERHHQKKHGGTGA